MPKISDFGLARWKLKTLLSTLSLEAGSVPYLAPVRPALAQSTVPYLMLIQPEQLYVLGMKGASVPCLAPVRLALTTWPAHLAVHCLTGTQTWLRFCVFCSCCPQAA